MQNVVAAIVMFALFFVFLGIRVLLGKDKAFRGSCGSMNVTGSGDGSCSICGRKEGDPCGNEDEPSEAMKAAIAAESKSV